MKTWDQILLDADQARREGRNPYGKPRFTDAEIDAAFKAEFKLPSEWLPDDVINMDCGMRGFWIKGPGGRAQGKIVEVFPDTVQVQFADGAVQSYIITPALTVRRVA